jgi:hypothetical protein
MSLRSGYRHYRAMGHALSSVLQQLLPSGDMYICSQLESTANDSYNGFKLLWTLLKCYIDMFGLTNKPSWPDWQSNIFRYAKRVLMHCNLSHYRSTKYYNAQRSLLIFKACRASSRTLMWLMSQWFVSINRSRVTLPLSLAIYESFRWLRCCLTSTRVVS